MSESDSAFTPVFSRGSVAQAISRRRRISCSAKAASIRTTGSPRPACASGWRRRRASGASRGTRRRTTSNSPLSELRARALQSGLSGRVFAAVARRTAEVDAARQQRIIAMRNLKTLSYAGSESAVQTLAAVKTVASWTVGRRAVANVTVQQRSLELAQESSAGEPGPRGGRADAPLDLLQAEAEVAQRRENLISKPMPRPEDAEDATPAAHRGTPSEASFLAGTPSADRRGHRRRRRCRMSMPSSTGTFSEQYDLARAKKDLREYPTNAAFLRRTETSGRATRSVVSWNRARWHAVAAARQITGTVTGPAWAAGFGNVLGHMSAADYPSWSVGLTVNYSLGQSYEEAGLRAPQVERRQGVQRIASLQLRDWRRSGRRQGKCTARQSDPTPPVRAKPWPSGARCRAAAVRSGPLDELSCYAGAARSAAGGGEPASGDARPSVRARQLRSVTRGARWASSRAVDTRGPGLFHCRRQTARVVQGRGWQRVLLRT